MKTDILQNFTVLIFGLKPLVIDSWRNDDNFIVTLLLFGAFVFLLLLILGVIIGLLLIAIAIGLVSAGIISTSVLVGIQKKSINKGFKTFFLISSIIGSCVISVIAFLFMNIVNKWNQTDLCVFAGLVCGVGFGWFIGYLMYLASSKTVLFLQRKYKVAIAKNPLKIGNKY